VLDAGGHTGAARKAAGGVNHRTLGRTGLSVSEIGFGAWAIGGNEFGNSYGPTDDAESARAIRRAFELGCNFFDTADVYGHGHSEELIGAALSGVRSEVTLGTKVGGNFYNRDVLNAVPRTLQPDMVSRWPPTEGSSASEASTWGR
jgi:aryl-alcohol dehydrogenase-like predicted oxidoreductase